MIQKPILALQIYINKAKKLIKKPEYSKSWLETQQQWEKIRNQQIQVVVQNDPQIIGLKKASPRKQKFKQLNVGCEFDNQIQNETDLIKYIVHNQFYKAELYMSEDQIDEFQQVFNQVDEIDGRIIGSIIGMAMLGFIGFIALGFTVFGVIAGGVLGVIMGRYAGKRIKRQLKRKRNKLVELDIFEIKLRCYLKWVKVQMIKYKYNINQARFIVEKLFLEVKPILHYKKFSKSQQKQIREVLQKVFRLMKQPQIVATILLSFRLCQEYLAILQSLSQKNLIKENEKLEQQQIARQDLEICLIQGIDNLLKPIMTITSDFKLKKGTLKQLQLEIKQFLLQPEIIHLGQQCPDPQMSLEFIKLFAEKMKFPVNTVNLKNYLKDQNYRDLEMIGRLIEQEGMQRQISQYPTERTKIKRHSMMEKVIEQEDESEDEYIIEEENKQINGTNLNKEINQSIHKVSNRKSDRKVMQQLELPNNEQEFSDSQKKHSSSGNSIFQINKDEHPNRIITKQILQISGDEMIANITPLRKSNELNIEDIKTIQKQHQNDLKVSTKLEDKEIKKSKSPSKLKSEYQDENRQLISEQNQEIEIAQQLGFESDNPNYDESILMKFDLMKEILNESVATWENVTKSDNIYIYKTMKPGKSNVFVKGYALLPEIDKETAFLAIYKQDFRSTWDKILQGFKIVASENELIDIIFYYVPAPVPIMSTREFLQKRILRREFPQKNQISLLFYSVLHEKQPLKKGSVRAETELAGYVFEDVQGGSQISFISNNDVKGAVPKILVNYASAKAPFNWFGNLRKACLLYKKFNGDLTKVKIR